MGDRWARPADDTAFPREQRRAIGWALVAIGAIGIVVASGSSVLFLTLDGQPITITVPTVLATGLMTLLVVVGLIVVLRSRTRM